MSSGSEKKYSMEELMEKNKPIVLPKAENHPTETEWAQMMGLQVQTVRLLSQICQEVERLPAPPSLYPVTEKLTAMERELTMVRKSVEQIEQAGRKKERRISLPKVSLPRPTWAWLWAIPVVVALGILWYASGVLSNYISPLFQPPLP